MSLSFMRGMWSVVVITVCAYGGYLFFGSQISAASSGESRPVVIRDVVRGGEHFLSGSLDVGFSCENLHLEDVSITGVNVLTFSTWRDPALPCSPGPILRPFALALFAPSNATFTATLDDAPLDIVILRETSPLAHPGTLK